MSGDCTAGRLTTTGIAESHTLTSRDGIDADAATPISPSEELAGTFHRTRQCTMPVVVIHPDSYPLSHSG